MHMCRRGGYVIALAFVVSLAQTLCFSALAADLAPIVNGGGYFNWSGLYAGGNLGGGTGRTAFVVTAPGLTTTTGDEIRGFVGGGQAGYNWQLGPWVFGVEGDLQFSHQQNGVQVAALQISNSMDMFTTLRGRFGVALEDWLFYVTGGGGYLYNRANYNLGIFGGVEVTDFSPVWAAGAGVETLIWGRWTGKLEYLYLGSDSISNSFAVPVGPVSVSKTIHDNVIRTGLNFHF
jgi:outer membrane immunogenic protein